MKRAGKVFPGGQVVDLKLTAKERKALKAAIDARQKPTAALKHAAKAHATAISTKTKTYRISNRISGADMGDFEALTEREALELMAVDAGYQDFAQACRVTESDGSDLRVEEVTE